MQIFRYFAIIGLLYFFFRSIYVRFFITDQVIPTFQTIYFVLVHAVLFLVLTIPGLDRRLKEYYLPVILVLYSAAMVFGSLIYLGEPETNILQFMTNTFSLVPILMVPLVLIAWQYDMRAVLAYTVFTNLADLIISWQIVGRISLATLPVLGLPVIRSFAFGLVGSVVCQLTTVQRAQKYKLMLANIQLGQYTNTLERLATSRERNRLARELHDTLAHTLSGISVNLEALKTMLDPERADMHTMVDNALSTARNGLSETRRALQDLRAQPLEDLGLGLALQAYSASLTEREGLEVTLDIDAELGILPPAVEQTFYRIAQEALENIVLHASNNSFSLCLVQDESHLRMEIRDDGVGFEENKQTGSERYGLKGMRERAEAIGATLKVESKPGQGTRVSLEWEHL